MAYYRNSPPGPEARLANGALPGDSIGATSWQRTICSERAAFFWNPALMPRRLKDMAFRGRELGRGKSEAAYLESHEVEDHGCSIAEKTPRKLAIALRAPTRHCQRIARLTLLAWKRLPFVLRVCHRIQTIDAGSSVPPAIRPMGARRPTSPRTSAIRSSVKARSSAVCAIGCE